MIHRNEGAASTTKSMKKRDRRRAARFPVLCDCRYRLLDRESSRAETTGQTIDISSAGVLFSTQHQLVAGEQVELVIDWPAKLDFRLPLALVARGRATRCEEDRAAVKIMRYEFRLRGAGRVAPREQPATCGAPA